MKNIILTTVMIFLSSPVQSQNWTPKASHHQAACSIRIQDKQGYRYCSGVYIQAGDIRGVLTCAHAFECDENGCVSDVIVKWADGSVSDTTFTKDRTGADLAFVFTTHPTIKPIGIAGSHLRQGEIVEYLTYGAPSIIRTGKAPLRHFASRVTQISSTRTTYDATVIEGDSGGAILRRSSGKLVGIQTEGVPEPGGSPYAQSNGLKIYRGSRSPSLAVIQQFILRIKAKGMTGGFGQSTAVTQCVPCQQYRQYQPFPQQRGILNRQVVIQQPQPLPQIDPSRLFPPDIPTEESPEQQIQLQQPVVKPIGPELEAKLKAMALQLEAMQNQPSQPSEPAREFSPEPIATPSQELPEKVARSPTITERFTEIAKPSSQESRFSWLSLAWLAAGAAGVGVPAWVLLGRRAVKRIRYIREARTAEPATHHQEHHYVTSSPGETRYRSDSEFVNVENDRYRLAHEEARRVMARRYPGSQEILEAEKSLTQQFQAGQIPAHP